MDIKIYGITEEIFDVALEALKARTHILSAMDEVAESRTEISENTKG